MSASDKLRYQANEWRFYADGDPRDALTQRNMSLADALDLLADAWDAARHGVAPFGFGGCSALGCSSDDLEAVAHGLAVDEADARHQDARDRPCPRLPACAR